MPTRFEGRHVGDSEPWLGLWSLLSKSSDSSLCLLGVPIDFPAGREFAGYLKDHFMEQLATQALVESF